MPRAFVQAVTLTIQRKNRNITTVSHEDRQNQLRRPPLQKEREEGE